MEKGPSLKAGQEDRYTNQLIFGSDKLFRVQGKQLKKLPYKHIGAISFRSRKNPKDTGKGSGMLISENLVLTSAHNLYNFDSGEFHYELRFYLPGEEEVLKNPYEIEDFFLPGKYVLKPKIANDYALLKLARKVINPGDFIPLSGNVAKIDNNIILTICGYPGSVYQPFSLKGDIFRTKLCGFEMAGRVDGVNLDKAELVHFISTEAGQSGTSIVATENGKKSIVGIHKGGVIKRKKDQTYQANAARLMTPELIETLKWQAARMGASPFKVMDGEAGSSSYWHEIKVEKKGIQKKQEIKGEVGKVEGKEQLSWQNQRDTKKLMQMAKVQEKQGSNLYTEILERITKLDPRCFEAWIRLGKEYLYCENKKARKCFKQALKINSNSCQAYLGLGNCQQDNEYFIKALQCDPKCSQAYYQLVQSIYTNNLRRSDACRWIKRAMDLDPTCRGDYDKVGQILFQINLKHDAKQILTKAIQSYKTNNVMNYVKAKTYWLMYKMCQRPGEEKVKRQYLQNAIKAGCKSDKAHYHMALNLKQDGKHLEAIKQLFQSIYIKPDYMNYAVDCLNAYIRTQPPLIAYEEMLKHLQWEVNNHFDIKPIEEAYYYLKEKVKKSNNKLLS